MRTFEANILADSTCNGNRITTFLLQYPRIIHAQVMTYRQAGRNSESTRAREPFKSIAEIRADPFVPDLWPLEQRGMQPKGFFESSYERDLWIEECHYLCDKAEERVQRGVHHEIAMRPLEPFMWHRLLYTSTNFDNMLHQRLDAHTQRQFQLLAYQIKQALDTSKPRKLQPGDWHIAFDREDGTLSQRLLRAVGRSARLSFANHLGLFSNESDESLARNVVFAEGHMTPCEHQAQAMYFSEQTYGPLTGWKQLRLFYPYQHDAQGCNEKQKAEQRQWVEEFFA